VASSPGPDGVQSLGAGSGTTLSACPASSPVCLSKRSRPNASSGRRLSTVIARRGAEDLVGVSLLHFDADGLVVEEWDIWVERQSAGEPPWAGAR
jgi:hypothetical protein